MSSHVWRETRPQPAPDAEPTPVLVQQRTQTVHVVHSSPGPVELRTIRPVRFTLLARRCADFPPGLENLPQCTQVCMVTLMKRLDCCMIKKVLAKRG